MFLFFFLKIFLLAKEEETGEITKKFCGADFA